jgi:hypothetical protein
MISACGKRFIVQKRGRSQKLKLPGRKKGGKKAAIEFQCFFLTA